MCTIIVSAVVAIAYLYCITTTTAVETLQYEPKKGSESNSSDPEPEHEDVDLSFKSAEENDSDVSSVVHMTEGATTSVANVQTTELSTAFRDHKECYRVNRGWKKDNSSLDKFGDCFEFCPDRICKKNCWLITKENGGRNKLKNLVARGVYYIKVCKPSTTSYQLTTQQAKGLDPSQRTVTAPSQRTVTDPSQRTVTETPQAKSTAPITSGVQIVHILILVPLYLGIL